MVGVRNNLKDELLKIVGSNDFNDVSLKYKDRIKQGDFTRDENPASHFCVYFASFDENKKEIFIGHHKKSGLWLFNGGHIDKGEIIQ